RLTICMPSSWSARARPRCCLTSSGRAISWWLWRRTAIMCFQIATSSPGSNSYAGAAAFASSAETKHGTYRKSAAGIGADRAPGGGDGVEWPHRRDPARDLKAAGAHRSPAAGDERSAHGMAEDGTGEIGRAHV